MNIRFVNLMHYKTLKYNIKRKNWKNLHTNIRKFKVLRLKIEKLNNFYNE